MEKHREKYNSSSETNYKLSRDHQVMRHGRTLLGRGDPSSAVGFSWPPRSYTCSFCKREFRSAQALGGHMNVHRRDRARLRQCSPPWDQPSPSNPIPNFKHNTIPNPVNVPNLNMPPPSLSTTDDKPSSVLYTFPSLISPHAFPLSSNSSSSSLFGVRELRNFMEEGGRKDGRIMREKTEVLKLSLDMEIDFGDLDGSLDLELKLGYT